MSADFVRRYRRNENPVREELVVQGDEETALAPDDPSNAQDCEKPAATGCTETGDDGDGCDCSSSGHSSGGFTSLALIGLALTLVRRRRRA